MLDLFIIEEIEKLRREQDEPRTTPQPQIELPALEPRAPTTPAPAEERGVTVIDLA